MTSKDPNKNMFSVIYSYMLEEIGGELDTKPGEEFKSANDAGLKIKSQIVLGDRPVSITVDRLWSGFSLFQKFRLLYYVATKSNPIEASASELSIYIEKLKQEKDLLTMEIEALADYFPWLVESLINERDVYMAIELHQTLQQIAGSNECDVVAVMGCGHVAGFTQYFEKIQHMSNEEINRAKRVVMLSPNDPTPFSKSDLRNYAEQMNDEYYRVKQNKEKAPPSNGIPAWRTGPPTSFQCVMGATTALLCYSVLFSA
jgi:pheromone shutdown protein TraB